MDQDEMKKQKKAFAKQIIDLCMQLPDSRGDVGWSKLPRRLPWALEADFISKIGIVLEEADESLDWLEILFESNTVK